MRAGGINFSQGGITKYFHVTITLGQGLFDDQIVPAFIQAHKLRGMSSSIVQNHELLYRLRQNGISHIHRKARSFFIPLQFKGFTEATVIIQGEKLVHDTPFQVSKRACFGSAFERSQETRCQNSIRITSETKTVQVDERDAPVTGPCGNKGCPNISRNRFPGWS